VALLKREWSHFASSPSVILNTSLGIVFTIVMAVALLIKGEDLLFMLGSIPKEAKGMIEGFKMPILCLAVIQSVHLPFP
jgi:ABC-2 type transport system permease protein